MSREPEIVSKNMRKIHSKDTSIEVQLRKALWHKGYRYRKNYKALPGSPDIVLTKYKIAIFCDSEFFHGKDWEILKLRLEKGKNPEYWIKRKLNVIVLVTLKRIKSFFSLVILLYISGDKTSKSILMSVSRPLKRLYGILPFPMTLLNLQTNNKKICGRIFFANTATNFLYIYYLCKHNFFCANLNIVHQSNPPHLILPLQVFIHALFFCHLFH